MAETTPPDRPALDGVLGRMTAGRAESSIPLLATGAVLSALGPFLAIASPGLHDLLSHAAAPLALALIAMLDKLTGQRFGLGIGNAPLKPGNAVVVACLVLLSSMLGFLGTAAVLVVLGVVRSNAYLVGCSLCFTLLMLLESLYFFDNRLYELAGRIGLFRSEEGYFPAAPAIVYTVFGLLLLAAGFSARTKAGPASR